jgi:hypothetical protein
MTELHELPDNIVTLLQGLTGAALIDVCITPESYLSLAGNTSFPLVLVSYSDSRSDSEIYPGDTTINVDFINITSDSNLIDNYKQLIELMNAARKLLIVGDEETGEILRYQSQGLYSMNDTYVNYRQTYNIGLSYQ